MNSNSPHSEAAVFELLMEAYRAGFDGPLEMAEEACRSIFANRTAEGRDLPAPGGDEAKWRLRDAAGKKITGKPARKPAEIFLSTCATDNPCLTANIAPYLYGDG